MELLAVCALGGLVATTWICLRLLQRSLDFQVSVFANLVGGYRGEGWPVGVQEEDRDHPWGKSPAPGTDGDDERAARVEVSRLEPAVRARL